MTAITFHELQQFEDLRKDIFKALKYIHEVVQESGKSAEGSLTINYPGVWEDNFSISLYSYLLCPEGRNKAWFGRTFQEALALATQDIKCWTDAQYLRQQWE